MFSSGKVPHRPEDNLAMTALLPSVYLFSKVCAFEQNNSLAACKHFYFTAPAHLVDKVCLSSAVPAFACTCSQLMTKPHEPVKVCRWGRCLPPHFFCALRRTVTVFNMAASHVHAFPLQTGVFRVERAPLSHHSHADLLSNIVFLIPVDRKLFSPSPWASVTGMLPPFFVRASVCTHVCRLRGCLPLCLHMCEYFSGVEAAFMSVPSVENGSVTEGQPLVLHWASHSEVPNAFICWIFVICPWNYNWEHLIPVGPDEWSSSYLHVDINWAVFLIGHPI